MSQTLAKPADSPEARLFAAVLSQAFIDAVAPDEPFPNKAAWLRGRPKREKRRGLEVSEIARAVAWDKAVTGWKSRRGRTAYMRREARLWLTTRSADLELICRLAGREPDAVVGRAKILAQAGWDAAALELSNTYAGRDGQA